jgi:uncharacterized damage-inducible protein DinB
MTDRPAPATDAGEKDMLCGFMDFHRATLLWKIDGLADEQLRTSLVPSATTLLGMVKHLARVEHQWFTVVFAGEDAGIPLPTVDDDWVIDPDETTQDIVRLYHEACERSRAIVEAASLDDVARWGKLKNRRPDEVYTLRWILIHMIEETARHVGQADILREQIDGVTGE